MIETTVNVGATVSRIIQLHHFFSCAFQLPMQLINAHPLSTRCLTHPKGDFLVDSDAQAINESERLAVYTVQQPAFKRAVKTAYVYIHDKYLAKYINLLRRGEKFILLSYPIYRGGNWLYLWAYAATLRHRGTDKASLLYGPGMEAWTTEFPKLASITASSSEYTFFTRRSGYFPKDIEKDIGEEDLHFFVREYLLSSEAFSKRLARMQNLVDENSFVINIRRGDYYSVPQINEVFGIDTVTYVEQALKKLQETVTPSKIIFVSDDLQWCAENLSHLNSVAPCIFEKQGSGMFDDLALVASAPYLILTNTTFGYWGAYIGELLAQKLVLSPGIHQVIPESRPKMHRTHWVTVHHPEGKNWISGEPL